MLADLEMFLERSLDRGLVDEVGYCLSMKTQQPFKSAIPGFFSSNGQFYPTSTLPSLSCLFYRKNSELKKPEYHLLSRRSSLVSLLPISPSGCWLTTMRSSLSF